MRCRRLHSTCGSIKGNHGWRYFGKANEAANYGNAGWRYFAFYRYFGPVALGFHFVWSFITALLTDNANYIEHYGLRRKRLSDKKDAWNTSDRTPTGC